MDINGMKKYFNVNNKDNIIRTSKQNLFISIVFGLSYVLNIYTIGIPYLDLAQTILLIYFIIYGINDKFHFFNLSYFRSFIIYSFFISLFGIIFTPWINELDVFHGIVSLLLFFFLLFASIKYVNFSILVRTIYYLGIVCIIFFYLQYLLAFLGIHISGVLPLPLASGNDYEKVRLVTAYSIRLSSFFTEPAHYASFIALFIAYVLFNIKKNAKTIFIVILAIISVVLSGSALGLTEILILCFFWLYTIMKNKKYKIFYMILFSIFFIGFYGGLKDNTVFVELFDRYNEITDTQTASVYGKSSYIRVMRGYIPFVESNIERKFLGNGLQSIKSYSETHQHSKFLSATNFNNQWVNSIQFLLFSVGIVGILLYFLQIFILYKNTTIYGRSVILLLLSEFFSADAIFSLKTCIILYIVILETKKLNDYVFSNNTSL